MILNDSLKLEGSEAEISCKKGIIHIPKYSIFLIKITSALYICRKIPKFELFYMRYLSRHKILVQKKSVLLSSKSKGNLKNVDIL